MSEKKIAFFNVGNGNCALATVDGFLMGFDLHSTENKNSYEFLKPQLRKNGGKYYLDTLFISHGDEDHCQGFEDFKKAIDKGELVIGAIIHPGYDRKKVTKVSDLPESYLALDEEVKRRNRSNSAEYGNIEISLKAGDSENVLRNKIQELPKSIRFLCLNPFKTNSGDEENWDTNDQSLVINLQIDGIKVLFTGDTGKKSWQEQIIPFLEQNTPEKLAKTDILVCSHHGSYSFFGEDRQDVLNANPCPDNYGALDHIGSSVIVISAGSKFPLDGDSKQEQPPHYAAYKWYKKWFVDNQNVKNCVDHPDEFKYTCDGHLLLKLTNGQWYWTDDWVPPSDDHTFQYRGGDTERKPGRYA